MRRLVAACGLCAAALGAAAATWRVEVHPFESLQFSGAALLAAGDACVTRGMAGGPDVAARAAVHADVISFLRTALAAPR